MQGAMESTHPNSGIGGNARAEEMMGIILGLPKDQRMALLLFKYRQLTRKEIADTLGYSEDLVGQLLVDAIKMCRFGRNAR